MKKLLLLPLMALALMVNTPSAGATVPDIDNIDLRQVKVTLCHWANGNSHAISVSAAAAATHLVFHVDTGWQPAPGHEHDRFLHLGAEIEGDDDANCAGDDTPDKTCADFSTKAELDAYLNTLSAEVRAALMVRLDKDDDGIPCEFPPDTPPTTQPPVVEEPPVVVEVPVEKTVCDDGTGHTFEQAVGPCPETVIEKTVTVEKEVTPTTTAPRTAPKPVSGELPHTGGETAPLAALGASVTVLGVALRRFFK